MLKCELTRGQPYVKQSHVPEHQISGIVGLSGRAAGTVVLSLNRDTALAAAEILLLARPQEINAEVRDVVGELTNMVAGAAKSQLAELQMSLAIPTVVMGRFTVQFPSSTNPICVPFESALGSLTIEVGLVETGVA